MGGSPDNRSRVCTIKSTCRNGVGVCFVFGLLACSDKPAMVGLQQQACNGKPAAAGLHRQACNGKLTMASMQLQACYGKLATAGLQQQPCASMRMYVCMRMRVAICSAGAAQSDGVLNNVPQPSFEAKK